MAYYNGKLEPIVFSIPITELKYVIVDIPRVPKTVAPESRSKNGSKTGGANKTISDTYKPNGALVACVAI